MTPTMVNTLLDNELGRNTMGIVQALLAGGFKGLIGEAEQNPVALFLQSKSPDGIFKVTPYYIIYDHPTDYFTMGTPGAIQNFCIQFEQYTFPELVKTPPFTPR